MQNHKPHRQHLTLTLLVLATAALLQAIAATPAALAAESCPNQAVREQQNAGYLPDCRAYEQVSPAQKNENEVEGPFARITEADPFQAAMEGAGIAYTTNGAFPGSLSSGFRDHYLSASGALGSPWQTLSLNPDNQLGSLEPGKSGRSAGTVAYLSADLTCGIEQSELPLTALPEGESAEEHTANLYVWNAAANSYTLVTNVKPERGGRTAVDGASADCSHVIFEDDEEDEFLAPENALLEWDQGELRVASLLPDEAPPAEGISKNDNAGSSDLNEISSNGSRVFFTAETDEEGVDEEYEEVFMRLDGEKTVEVSASETGIADTGANFQIASKSGEQVFFTANYGLTTTSSTGATRCERKTGAGCDLYDYNAATGALSDISADTNSDDATGADVIGVLGISEEGGVVYFSASGQLVPDKGNTEADDTADHEANVYAYRDGSLSYVASIGETEAGSDYAGGSLEEEVDALNGAAGQGSQYTVSRVSGDGEYLLFATAKPIVQSDGVTYDNTDATSGKADFEDYEYSLASGRVTCVSCDPSGAPPKLRTGANTGSFAVEFGQYEANDAEMLRNLASNGEVFFQTTNPVLPQAENDSVNVYEWEPEGVGTCPSGQAAGCVAILDSGDSPDSSYFEGASANGEDVYVTTYSQLAPEDQDGLRDMYDVREDGGFLQTAAVGCAGEECRGSLPEPEGVTTPGSTLPSVNGNLTPPALEASSEGKAAKAVLSISSKTLSGSTLTLKVAVSVAGSLTVSGADVSRASKTATARSTLTLRVKLTKPQAAKLAKRKRVKAKLTVTFAPKSGKKLTKKFTVTFKR